MALEVVPVNGRFGRYSRYQFVDVPFRIFGDDPAWVPPLRMSVHDRISPKYPANEHQDTRLWLAVRRGEPVGRIGACIDRFFNDYQGVSWGWLGFFESLDDPEAANALFDTACRWVKSMGATTAVGPASFTTNDDIGLLVEGFEDPPVFLTTHNPPYYERLWVDAGWQQAMDLYGWRFDQGIVGLSERQRRTLERLQKRANVTIRGMRMKDFDAEVGRLFEVYNAAWSKNWGFAPMPEPEIRHLAKQMKQLIDPDLAMVVEKPDGEPIAVTIVLPDINSIMPKIRSGRLAPVGWYHLLRGLKSMKRARVLALGVKPGQQNLALGPLLYGQIIDRLTDKGYKFAEASWILATNDRMNGAIELMGAKRYKTWRLYQREL
jgi:hypothetical protein